MTDKTAKTKAKKAAPKAKGGGKKACKIQGCKRAYRAKGFCFFHHAKWRRGELEAVEVGIDLERTARARVPEQLGHAHLERPSGRHEASSWS